MVALEPFQDVVKAVALIRQLLHDLVGDGRAIWVISEQRRGRKAAGQLGTLSFSNDGTRKHLEQIAEGNAEPADFVALAAKLDETGKKVEAAMDRLAKAREHIRETHGLRFANELSELIYGAGGKTSIRIDVQELAYLNASDNPDPEVARQNAQAILKTMEAFNERVETFHDKLLGLERDGK